MGRGSSGGGGRAKIAGGGAKVEPKVKQPDITKDAYGYKVGDIDPDTGEPMDGADITALQKAWAIDPDAAAYNGGAKMSSPVLNALENYSGGESFAINESLYKGKVLTNKEADFVQRMDTALDAQPMYAGKSYRRMEFDTAEEARAYADSFVVGEGVQMKAYTSSAKDTKGYSFAKNPGPKAVKMVINSKKGRDLTGESGGVAVNPLKREIVHPRDSRFKVTRKVVRKDGTTFIYLEDA